MSQNQCCSDSSAWAHTETRADTCTRMHTCRSHLVSSLNMVLRVQGPHFEDCWGQGS